MRHDFGLTRLIRLLAPAALCGLTACGGSGETGGEQTPDNPIGGGPGGNACETTEIALTPLRRLTRFEYKNTVRDLLQVDTDAVYEIPADEADGYDNNAALQVAPEFLIEKYVVVSEALAALAVENVSELTACDAGLEGTGDCARQFAESFGRLAFRRPLTDDDMANFMAAYDLGTAGGGSHAEGIEVMIRLALQSPHFLYRLETGAPIAANATLQRLNPYETATRMAYFLWASGPDDELLDAAANGELDTRAQIASRARQMLNSPKARDSLGNFIAQWSGLKKLETLTRNTELFPNYSNSVRDAMKREMPAFLDYLFAEGHVTLGQLFTANSAFVSGPLAGIYGVTAPPNSATTARRVTLPEEQARAGLFTQAGFLAVQGHPDQTSPVLRGKFVRANLLCTPPPPPPDDVDISVPELSEGTTARDRAAVHLAAGGGCSGCHVLMDPIGLAFENFDAIGQHRYYENGVLIDASGEVMAANDPALAGEFVGVRELAEKLAASEVVHDCVASHMFRYSAGRHQAEADACSVTGLKDVFVESGGDLVELMVAVTQTDAFLHRATGVQP